MRAWLLLALAACGRGSTPAHRAGPTSAVSPSTLELAPAAGDVVVATVDGHPVYGSCVAAQAEAHGLDARAALDECVAFELLAREAEARGLLGDLDVADAWRRELVRGVIEADLGKLTSFDQLPPAFLASIKFDEQQRPLLHRPEIRAAYYIRAAVPKNTVLGSPVDVRAHALADAMYAEVKDRDDVTAPELFAIGERVARDRGNPAPVHENAPVLSPKEHGPVRTLVQEFRDALFELPAIGTVHAPVRTAWGWDVILWHDTTPAADLTDEIFQSDVRRFFVPWSDDLARRLGVTPTIDEDVVATLGRAGGDVMVSPFAAILRQAVERTPRAIGGAFAAPDGEMVDFYSTIDPIDWAILTAHNGVILSTLQAAFATWHFGGVEFFVVEHSKVDVLVHDVCLGYFALLAVEQPAPLGAALGSLVDAVVELRKEMG